MTWEKKLSCQKDEGREDGGRCGTAQRFDIRYAKQLKTARFSMSDCGHFYQMNVTAMGYAAS
jgi:hypothetical protein